MNDFFLANSRTSYNSVNDVEVRQVIVADLDEWSHYAETICDVLKKDYSNENLEKAVTENKIYSIKICSLVTDLTDSFIFSLLSTDADKFLSLFNSVVLTNQTYFDHVESKNKSNNTDTTWFDSFQVLISKGHRHSEIMNYSYGVFTKYLKAAHRDEINKIISMSNAVRAAHHADTSDYSKFIDNLKSS